MLFYEDEEYKGIEKNVYYFEKEYSFCTSPSEIASLPVTLGSEGLELDVNLETMRVLEVSGYCPKSSWINKPIKLKNKIKKAGVILKTEKEVMSGVGVTLQENTPIYYNRISKWICVGDDDNTHYDECIEFVNNAILCLYQNEFKALWMKPRYNKR